MAPKHFEARLARAAALATTLIVAACTGVSAPSSATPGASVETSVEPSTTVKPPFRTPLPTSPPIGQFFRVATIEADRDFGVGAVGDFDHDGIIDMVTDGVDGNLSLLLGSGGGAFDFGADYLGGQGPSAMTSSDLNDDGWIDLILTHTGVSDMGTGADDVVVLLADGAGGFTRTARETGANAQSLVLADLNGDGLPDLATANESDHLTVAMGLGNGEFKLRQDYPTKATFSSGIAAADFNGDDVLDLVTTNSLVGLGKSDHTISILMGTGHGAFSGPTVLETGGNQPIHPVVADLDEDGDLDLAMPNGGGAVDASVFLGNGDGTFGPAIKYGTGPNPHSLAVADMDGDGRLDLVSGDEGWGGGPVERGVSILFGLGDGTFERKVSFSQEGLGGGLCPVADLDANGTLDLIVGGYGNITLLFNAIAR